VERARQAMEETTWIVWEQEKAKAKPSKKVGHGDHSIVKSA
jgi:hypothetical protein